MNIIYVPVGMRGRYYIEVIAVFQSQDTQGALAQSPNLCQCGIVSLKIQAAT